MGLGLTLWEGKVEDASGTWLRRCDAQGDVLPTRTERAEQEHARAERLAARLREMGIEPEE